MSIADSPTPDDLEVAASLREWAGERAVARKRARSIAVAFGHRRLTARARQRIAAALTAAGLEPSPPLSACDREDWIELVVVGDPIVSDRPPTQLVTWHAFNWTGHGDSGPVGEWLRCLRDTRAGDRQLVWSGAAIAGVVTFAGWIRQGPGFY